MLSSRAVKHKPRGRDSRCGGDIPHSCGNAGILRCERMDAREADVRNGACALLITIIAAVMRVNSRDMRLMV